jgi:APA family basic amino acid/polyamine antiporter
MYETGWRTWIQFALFLAVGLAVYAVYGRRHSTLAKGSPEVTPDAADREPLAV